MNRRKFIKGVGAGFAAMAITTRLATSELPGLRKFSTYYDHDDIVETAGFGLAQVKQEGGSVAYDALETRMGFGLTDMRGVFGE